MKIREVIEKYSPKEVYASIALLYLVLFLNASELFRYHIRLGDIFEIRHSIIYGLIRGVGDYNLSLDAALILYWLLAVLFVFVGLLKAQSISNWLMSKNEKNIRYHLKMRSNKANTSINNNMLHISGDTLGSKEEELFEATRAGDFSRVKVLVASGANPNVKDSSGYSPADYARGHGFSEIQEFLENA